MTRLQGCRLLGPGSGIKRWRGGALFASVTAAGRDLLGQVGQNAKATWIYISSDRGHSPAGGSTLLGARLSVTVFRWIHAGGKFKRLAESFTRTESGFVSYCRGFSFKFPEELLGMFDSFAQNVIMDRVSHVS